MLLKQNETIVFAGDSVTDAGKIRPMDWMDLDRAWARGMCTLSMICLQLSIRS